ncbi:MAG: hypothetical protein IT385_13545 [Deltaproteobacteria bacterium]|nr:hypothetical protein [Deltaproteobacteria bacterium]
MMSRSLSLVRLAVLAIPIALALAASDAGRASPERDILVTTTAELVSAMTPSNAGRTIRVRPGIYTVSAPLEVPDGATLAGDGRMLFDDDGLPMGIDPATAPLLVHTAVTAGDMVRLGDGSRVSGLVLQEAALPLPTPPSSGPNAGNLIAVVTNEPGDRITASIDACELINPNPSGVGGQHGPTRRAIMILSRNRNQGAAPDPDHDSELTVRITRTIIRSPRAGSGIFAINFASRSSISLSLHRNVIGGGLDTNGGVTLGVTPENITSESEVEIFSHGNLYRDDSQGNTIGVQATGCSGSPLGGPLPSLSNSLRMHSVNDRFENFNNAFLVAGARRYFAETGFSSGCSLELQLVGAYVQARDRGFRFYGALASVPAVTGSDNELRVLMRGVTNDSARGNLMADEGFYVPLNFAGWSPTDIYYATDPDYPQYAGLDNRLELIGNLQSFESTNDAGEPLPEASLFGND